MNMRDISTFPWTFGLLTTAMMSSPSSGVSTEEMKGRVAVTPTISQGSRSNRDFRVGRLLATTCAFYPAAGVLWQVPGLQQKLSGLDGSLAGGLTPP